MGETVEDIWEAGSAAALAIFGYIAVILLWTADSTQDSVTIFTKTVTVLLLAAFPTTEVGIYLAVFMAAVGASISISMLGAKRVFIIFTAGFFWCGTNIIMNWFFGPL
ncbi:hypothetical protein [Natronosalvus caseinilyticus]|uniref:hypothetical protein n=1 Tax=Natronosalvus caseinilyticus TaxID=2953747 RepID=UPI0028A80791|nr:hypothetical protein [Natronosalvus caseinilyticus]